jgi:hypothetical protein
MGRHTSPSCIHLSAILLFSLISFLVFPGQSSASPLPETLLNLWKRYSGTLTGQEPPGGYAGSPSSSNFPSDPQINAAWIPPSQQSYVFYTEITNPEGNTRAYDFAAEIGGVAIENTFPDQYM